MLSNQTTGIYKERIKEETIRFLSSVVDSKPLPELYPSTQLIIIAPTAMDTTNVSLVLLLLITSGKLEEASITETDRFNFPTLQE